MSFRSSPLAVRDALERVRSELGPLGLHADDLGTVEIVMAEALNNIVEHAFPAGEDEGSIDIDCRMTPAGLHVRIIDDGCEMPGGRLPEGGQADPTSNLSDLPEGGFGWFMIRQLAGGIGYRRDRDRNVLDLVLTLSPAG